MILAACNPIKWKHLGFLYVVTAYQNSRFSPTLSAMKEIPNEYLTNPSQEPKITSYVSGDPKLIQAFKEGKDVYASIASVSFGVPYEECLEFHPETHEYQKEGKARRTEAKSILLGRLRRLCPAQSICA